MIRNFKNRKSLQILVLIGLLCPFGEQANPALRLWIMLNKPLIEKVVGKVGQYIASSAIGASIAAHLQKGSESNFAFGKNDLHSLKQPSQQAPQLMTQGLKKAAQKVVTSTDSAKITTFINKNLTPIPTPSNMPSALASVATASRVPKISISSASITTPTINIAIAPTQSALTKIVPKSIKIPAPIPTTLAKSQGKDFELHSKNKLTTDIKEWLNEKEIIFVEG